MISQKNISIISNKSFTPGARRIPESIIEKDYCLAWFLFGLGQSAALRDKLIFKGGTALRRCYFSDYRFSEDLDYTLAEQISLDEILNELRNVFNWVKDESGIIFANARQEPSSANTHTIYLSYVGPLPGKDKEIKVDITYKEKIIKPIEEKSIIKTYEEYDDFLDGIKVKVYSLEEIAIEKICALFSPARNEPRDLYDIYNLIVNEQMDITPLYGCVEEKMAFKGILLERNKNEFLNKEARLKNFWLKRLSQQMATLPEFDDIFRAVKRAFRRAQFLTNNG